MATQKYSATGLPPCVNQYVLTGGSRYEASMHKITTVSFTGHMVCLSVCENMFPLLLK